MDLVKEISNKTVSISEFNKGFAGRIFDDVKANGSKVVLKNNTALCVLISPEDYSKLIEQLEDLKDLSLANERISSSKNENLFSRSDFEEKFSVNLDEVSPIDEDEIKWPINYLLLKKLSMITKA